MAVTPSSLSGRVWFWLTLRFATKGVSGGAFGFELGHINLSDAYPKID
jgi:hypothetical protein